MRLKVSYYKGESDFVDLSIVAEPTTTVGVIAQSICNRDPGSSISRKGNLSKYRKLSLAKLVDGSFVNLSPESTLMEAEIRSGDSVTLVDFYGSTNGQGRSASVATVRILSGPDAGKSISISTGTSYIGRDSSCDVVLNDPHVSKIHAKIHVTDHIEIGDNNSSNGTLVSGSSVQRANVNPEDIVTLGDTELVIIQTGIIPNSNVDSASFAFNRPPRINPYFEEQKFKVPDLPKRDKKGRFPIIAMVAPLVMGTVIYFMTKSVMYVAFMALSPMMIVGNFVEGRFTSKKSFRLEMEYFHKCLGELREDLYSTAVEEVNIRSQEIPSSHEVVQAIERLTPLLWTRRQGERGFLELRLGIGTLSSRTEIEVPDSVSKRQEGYKDIAQLISDFKFVTPVPVIADLKLVPSIGVASSGELGESIVRSLVMQICGLHSPSEVVVACLASQDSSDSLDWLKWLPHTSSPASPIDVPLLAVGQARCLDLTSSLEELTEKRLPQDAKKDLKNVAVVVLIRNDAPFERSRLVQLSENSLNTNIYYIWHCPSVSQLPASCRTYIEADSTIPTPKVVYVDDRNVTLLQEFDSVSSNVTLSLAKKMAPIYDVGARSYDESDLPLSVSFVSLAGTNLANDPDMIIERWQESNSIIDRSSRGQWKRGKVNSLRALVGQGTADPIYLELRSHGPHALVGGTTGAGKSEFLQTWIMGMALGYSPDRVTFLLVDYKGGSAFGDCAKLPHTVGIVTDLSQRLARRALISLSAELKYREQILNRKKAKDLIELERRGDPQCPPSLVIVIDEFAALISELPEFVDGVVNVAQRGRSLGLHLILATQRPAGAIKDNLRANTNLRIALRMADEADSMDVLDSSVSAFFDPAIPGRAAVKFGPGKLTLFQSGYIGGHTLLNPPPPQILLEELKLGQGRTWDEVQDEVVVDVDPGPTDIRRLANTISLAAKNINIEKPRNPWLPELAPIYNLGLLETRRLDSELVFAVSDRPEEQSQPTAAFFPDEDGNMVIFGTGGSGKSTALRSLAICTGFAVRGGPCHVYGLDYGSRGLHILEEIPHIGSIIGGDDIERTIRLLRQVRTEIDVRAIRYAKAKASTLTEYRNITGAKDEPRIFILIDGIQGFRQIYEGTDKQKWYDTLLGIAGDGRQVGVHLIITADRAAALSSALASSFQKKFVLRMASENDLGMLGLPLDSFLSDSPPGRGYMDGIEMQVAVFGGTPNLSEQANEVKKLAEAMEKVGVKKAPKIGKLSDRIRLSELPVESNGQPVIGIYEESLLPAEMTANGTFVLTGPAGSGRSTSLATLALALRRWNKDAKTVFFGSQKSLLTSLYDWYKCEYNSEKIAELAIEIGNEMADSSNSSFFGIFVENISDFLNTPADYALQELCKACLSNRQFFVAEGETSALSGSWPLLQAAKSSRAGIALQPDQTDGLSVFRTPFPRVNRGDFVSGRGLIVATGKAQTLQVALPE